MSEKKFLILMRHGESMWNLANLFTGWIDIPLSSKGIEESLEAGRQMIDLPIDLIFVSTLIRAQMSAMLAMSVRRDGKVPVIVHQGNDQLAQWSQNYGENSEKMIPVIAAWELNERMYGSLQGLNKARMIEDFGAEQVHIWRRSFDVAPPGGESLKMTADRTLPYFQKNIVPHLKMGKNIFISAHGNSLRSIMMHLESLSKEEVLKLELPTGKPVIYSYSDGLFSKVNFPQ